MRARQAPMWWYWYCSPNVSVSLSSNMLLVHTESCLRLIASLIFNFKDICGELSRSRFDKRINRPAEMQQHEQVGYFSTFTLQFHISGTSFRWRIKKYKIKTHSTQNFPFSTSSSLLSNWFSWNITSFQTQWVSLYKPQEHTKHSPISCVQNEPREIDVVLL